jgi:hypothetical protein
MIGNSMKRKSGRNGNFKTNGKKTGNGCSIMLTKIIWHVPCAFSIPALVQTNRQIWKTKICLSLGARTSGLVQSLTMKIQRATKIHVQNKQLSKTPKKPQHTIHCYHWMNIKGNNWNINLGIFMLLDVFNCLFSGLLVAVDVIVSL